MQRQNKRRTNSARSAALATTGAVAGSVTGGLALLASLGVGAVAMYLSDPHAGAARRRRIAQSAHSAFGSAGELATDLQRRAHAQLERHGERLAKLPGTALRGLHSAADIARDSARRGVQSASDYADRARDAAGDHMDDLHDRIDAFKNPNRGISGTSATVTAVGCAAAAAGALYLLDPQMGRRRRALLRDQSLHCVNEVGDFFQRIGRHVANKVRGTTARTRAMFRDEEVGDEQLLARVRSAFGHVVSNASEIEVTCQNGRITLSGPVRETERDGLIYAVLSTPGVRDLDNQLTAPNVVA